jgi:CBS domain containing-hemolysin-like protein
MKSCSNLVKKVLGWFSRVRKAMQLAPYIDDLYKAFEERGTEGELTRHERELLENTLAFGEITADDISVPRADVVAVPETADLKKVLKAFRASPHTRMPVYGRDLDDIKGIVNMKDVLAGIDKPEAFNLRSIIRAVTFVQESMTLPRILQIMKKTHVPFVLVTDEFGGTSGLVSIKDVLEKLVGDLDDVTESHESPQVIALGNGRFRVRGDCLLEQLDMVAGIGLQRQFEGSVETVGGAVTQVARTVPAKGSKITLDEGVEAVVIGTDGRRVLVVDIRVLG